MASLFGKTEKAVVDLDIVTAVGENKLKLAAKELSRNYQSVRDRWSYIIKPIVVSHLRGRLHVSWKQSFLQYLIESRVESSDQIDWTEVEERFPDQSRMSLQRVFLKEVGESNVLQLYKALESVRNRFCKRDLYNTDRNVKFRNQIIRIFKNVNKA